MRGMLKKYRHPLPNHGRGDGLPIKFDLKGCCSARCPLLKCWRGGLKSFHKLHIQVARCALTGKALFAALYGQLLAALLADGGAAGCV